jgi:hypothetical protein
MAYRKNRTEIRHIDQLNLPPRNNCLYICKKSSNFASHLTEPSPGWMATPELNSINTLPYKILWQQQLTLKTACASISMATISSLLNSFT